METDEERKVRWDRVAELKKIEKLEIAKRNTIKFPHNFDYRVNYAQILKDSGKMEESVVECKKCLELKKDNSHPFIIIIECLIQQNKYDDAQKYAQEMLFCVGVGNNYSCYMNGLVFVHMKKYQKALPFYQKAAEVQPDIEIVQDGLYICLVSLDRDKEALLLTTKLMKKFPDNIKYQIQYGQDLRRLKQFGKAEIVLKQCLKMEKNNEDCFTELVYCLADQTKYNEARKYAMLMLVELPQNVVSYYLNGYAFEQSNQYEKSKQYYKIAMEMDDDSMDSKEGYLYQLLNLTQWKEAREFCDDAIEKYPDSDQVYQWSALTYRYQFNLDEALNHYKKAFSLDQENMAYVSSYAIVLIDTGKLDLAKKIIQKMWDQNKKDDCGYLNFVYGLILREERKYKEAEKHFEDAIKATTSDRLLFQYRGHLCFVKGLYRESVEMFQKRLTYYYAVTNVHYYQALSLCKLNEFDKAFEAFNESLKFCPRFPKCHFTLGILLIKKMNKYEKGIYHIKKASDIDPKNETYLLSLKKYQIQNKIESKPSKSASKSNNINVMDMLCLNQDKPLPVPSGYNKNAASKALQTTNIKQWTNHDLLDWIKTIGLEVKWRNIMTQIIKSRKCTGKDWLVFNNFKDFAKTLNIKQPMLANRVFREFKKVKQKQVNVPDDSQPSTEVKTKQFTIIDPDVLESKHIDKWECYELQKWMFSLNLSKSLKKKVIAAISEQEVTGEDFNSMKCMSDVADSFEIETTSANLIYDALQKVRMSSIKLNSNENSFNKENDLDAVQLLQQWNLIRYKNVLVDNEGYDDPSYWKDISVEELKQMGFKTGHAKKFVHKSAKL